MSDEDVRKELLKRYPYSGVREGTRYKAWLDAINFHLAERVKLRLWEGR